MFNLMTEIAAPNFLERIVIFFQKSAPRPTNYGWFHLLFVALTIIAAVLLCVFCRDASDKIFRRILLIFWITVLVLEIYKQIVFSYSYNEEHDLGWWKYPWYAFPFQLCSSAIYLLPFAVFLKDGKVRDGVLSFLALFSFFGGLCVCVFPNDVFATDILGVQIQTMVHHGAQVALAIYIVAHERNKFDIRFFLKSIPVFVVMLVAAMLLNVVVHAFIEDTFNMFYISPYYACTLPLLSTVYEKVPYFLFLIIYVFGFALCAFIMFAIQFGVMKLCRKIYAEKHE